MIARAKAVSTAGFVAVSAVRIEKALAVETHKLADQSAEGSIGRSLDRREHSTKESREFARPERHLGDDAQTATATSYDPPLGAGIHPSTQPEVCVAPG
jgi:hypothetical protein